MSAQPNHEDPFPVIIGPTASGKSEFAVRLACALSSASGVQAEIVSADSMQIYRGLDIGSAKPTADEQRGIPHHLIDIVDPRESYSVDRWLAAAETAIRQIRSRGGIPVVVGGTHLYVKALLEGLFEGPEPDPALRQQLVGMDPDQRRALLERVDPAAAARIHRNDVRRTVRALEVFRQTGRPISEHQRQWDQHRSRTDCLTLGLLWETAALNLRINARCKRMLEQGLLDETRAIHAAGRFGPQSREGLGYKQLIEHLEGRCSLEESIERIKIETRRFAKNQRTWLRRLQTTPGSLWPHFPGTDTEALTKSVSEALLGRI